MLSRIFAFPAGPRAKWVIFLGTLAVVAGILAANLPGRFADAEKNESTSFLPGDAESTQALRITKRLEGGEIAPTVIVYRRDGGLRPADSATIARDVAELNRATRQWPNTGPFG